jgi:hypothetical protein
MRGLTTMKTIILAAALLAASAAAANATCITKSVRVCHGGGGSGHWSHQYCHTELRTICLPSPRSSTGSGVNWAKVRRH